MARTANPRPDDAKLTTESGSSSVNPRAAVLARRDGWPTDGRGFLYFDNWQNGCAGFIPDEDKELMLTDPQVRAALRIRRAAVTFEGIQILPWQPRGHSDYKLCAQIADDFRQALEEVDGGLHAVLEQVQEHDWWRHTAADIILVERTIRGKQFACFDLDVHLPDDYTVWKKENRLLGLQPVGSGATKDGKPVVIGAEKFLWTRYRPNSRYWCGTDLAGAVWIPFYMKNQGHPLNLQYLQQFSNPSLVGTAPEDATQPVPLLSSKKDAFGRYVPLRDENNQEITVSPQEAMASGLENFGGSGSTTVIPPKSKLALMEAQGDGRIFINYDDAQDWQIMVGVLGTGNMTGRAKYGSNASAQTGESTVEKPANIDGQLLAAAIRQKLGRLFVRWNYGEKHLDKVPRVIVGADDYLQSIFMAVIANSPAGQDERFLDELAGRTGAPGFDWDALKEKMAQATRPGTVGGTGGAQQQ